MEPKNSLKGSASLAITSINKGIEMEIEMRQHKYVTIDVIGTWANAKAFKLPALFLALLAYISCNHELSHEGRRQVFNYSAPKPRESAGGQRSRQNDEILCGLGLGFRTFQVHLVHFK